jgi:hypothetical protein
VLPLRLARHTSPSYPPASRKPVFGWLLHNKSIIGGRLRPQCIFIVFIFCRSIRAPNNWTTSPTRSALVASPLQRPPHCRRQLVVGYCVPPSNGGHLRPRVRPSIYFLLLINSTPQTTGSRPPHTFQPSLASSPTHPLTSSPSPI